MYGIKARNTSNIHKPPPFSSEKEVSSSTANYRHHKCSMATSGAETRSGANPHHANAVNPLTHSSEHRFELKKTEAQTAEAPKQLSSLSSATAATPQKTPPMDEQTAIAQINNLSQEFFQKDSIEATLEQVLQTLPTKINAEAIPLMAKHLHETMLPTKYKLFCGDVPQKAEKMTQQQLHDKLSLYNLKFRDSALPEAEPPQKNSESLLKYIEHRFMEKLITLIAMRLNAVNVIAFPQEYFPKSILSKAGCCNGLSISYLCDTENFQQHIRQNPDELFRLATDLQVELCIAAYFATKLEKRLERLDADLEAITLQESLAPEIWNIVNDKIEQGQYRDVIQLAISESKLDAIKTYCDALTSNSSSSQGLGWTKEQMAAAVLEFLLHNTYADSQYSKILECIIASDQLTGTEKKDILKQIRQEINTMEEAKKHDYADFYGLRWEAAALDDFSELSTEKNSGYLVSLIGKDSEESVSAHVMALKVDNNGMLSLFDPNYGIFTFEHLQQLKYFFNCLLALSPNLEVSSYLGITKKDVVAPIKTDPGAGCCGLVFSYLKRSFLGCFFSRSRLK